MQLKEFQQMITEILDDQAKAAKEDGQDNATPRKWSEGLNERITDMVSDCESEGID